MEDVADALSPSLLALKGEILKAVGLTPLV
jgi:hypothetical protein